MIAYINSAESPNVLNRRTTPHGEIQLQSRPQPDGTRAFEIIANGVFLMASYNRASERALATLALEWAVGTSLKVLVGGLGMGFTLRAALDHPSVEVVEVVEVESAIVAWNHTHLAALTGVCLDDPRVRLVQDDVVRYLAAAKGPYDAICLDVDNGPNWLASSGNRRLYLLRGLMRLRRVFGEAEAVEVQETDPWGHESGGVVYRARG